MHALADEADRETHDAADDAPHDALWKCDLEAVGRPEALARNAGPRDLQRTPRGRPADRVLHQQPFDHPRVGLASRITGDANGRRLACQSPLRRGAEAFLEHEVRGTLPAPHHRLCVGQPGKVEGEVSRRFELTQKCARAVALVFIDHDDAQRGRGVLRRRREHDAEQNRHDDRPDKCKEQSGPDSHEDAQVFSRQHKNDAH